jgi:hypothetical protein
MTDGDNNDKDTLGVVAGGSHSWLSSVNANVVSLGFQLEVIVCFERFFMNEVLQEELAVQFCQILTTHVDTGGPR